MNSVEWRKGSPFPCATPPPSTGGPMSAPTPQNTYDEFPYPSQPFVQTHPNHLGTMATLFGMKPPPVERCRVLELGCANGANMIPMAFGLPESTFVGIDLSE